MLTLYYMPGACSLSPHIVAHEAGIPLTLKRVSKDKKLEDGTNYFTINSKGLVPALQLETGEVLTEGPAIVQYLADQSPESTLTPPNGTFDRYRLQEWLNFITSNFTKPSPPCSPLPPPKTGKPKPANNSANAFLGSPHNWATNHF